jgi:elongation factor 1-gamma
MCVLGTAGDSAIRGYFVFRGQEVPFEVKDAADYDSYNFKKVDSADAKVRAEVNTYWDWTVPRFADGKIFK